MKETNTIIEYNWYIRSGLMLGIEWVDDYDGGDSVLLIDFLIFGFIFTFIEG